MSTTGGPNPLSVAWAVFRAQRVRRPNPLGTASVDHERLRTELATLRDEGIDALPSRRPQLGAYREYLKKFDPDLLSTEEALAYWLNLYNAGALDLAAEAVARSERSVLRIPGAFTRPWADVAGERLSLTEIEHGKIRRFRDPRIHAALVCGSASCPNLRFEPFGGEELDRQLDDQIRSFLAAGGAGIDRSRGQLLLSRILLWYGGDFTRPEHMPTWLPAGRRSLTAAITRWLDDESRDWVMAAAPTVVFRPYDWELACAVA